MAEPSTRKSFSDIRDDYAFFEEHSTEAQAVIDALASELCPRLAARSECHLLDFGVGPGAFTERLLRHVNAPASRLSLTLVEPDPVYLSQAIDRLSRFCRATPMGLRRVEQAIRPELDLAISNHVLYYVPKLEESVNWLIRSLKSGGELFATFANEANSLIQGWDYCFAANGEKPPYFRIADLIATLEKNPEIARVGRIAVQSEVRFKDEKASRESIVRFLTGSNYDRFTEKKAMLGFFDRFSKDGVITMPLTDEIFVIRRK